MYQKIKSNLIKPMKVKSKLNKKFIPVSIPYISNQDIKSVNKVLKKSWISSDGPEVKSFEEKFSKKLKEGFLLLFLVELLH